MEYQSSILKWLGNKIRIMGTLQYHIGSPRIFVEPFGGSLSVSLNTPAKLFRIGDLNTDLINLYLAVLNDNDFISKSEKLFDGGIDSALYYQRREEFNRTRDPSLFVYLNRHCFNGLTRYNKNGIFNSPFGDYDSVHFPRHEIVNFKKKFSDADTIITNSPFSVSSYYDGLGDEDVVYFDPPYFPLTDTANFVGYTADGFTYDKQLELAKLAEDIAQNGTRVIISNHDVPVARELYKTADIIDRIDVSRSVSSDRGNRKKAGEILAIWNPRPESLLFSFR